MSNHESDAENLPPLPPSGAPAAEICNIIQVYMAVENDLTPAQTRAVAAHIRTCSDCAHQHQVLRGLTRMVTRMPETEPSQRVDEAVLAAIAARRNTPRAQVSPLQTTARLRPVPGVRSSSIRKKPVSLVRRSSLLAAAAALILALVTSFGFIFHQGPFAPGFAMPGNLSWNGYVMNYTESMTGKDGTTYQVVGYYNLSNEGSNVQYTVPGKMDVMVVANSQKTLGLDVMHRLAQWNVEQPTQVDQNLFNAQQVRQDLQSGKAKYNGTVSFQGQTVYSITCPDSHVLLLDTDYMPVNVLNKGGKPVYDTMHWLSPSQVPASTWDLTVPPGFQMSQLSMPE